MITNILLVYVLVYMMILDIKNKKRVEEIKREIKLAATQQTLNLDRNVATVKKVIKDEIKIESSIISKEINVDIKSELEKQVAKLAFTPLQIDRRSI